MCHASAPSRFQRGTPQLHRGIGSAQRKAPSEDEGEKTLLQCCNASERSCRTPSTLVCAHAEHVRHVQLHPCCPALQGISHEQHHGTRMIPSQQRCTLHCNPHKPLPPTHPPACAPLHPRTAPHHTTPAYRTSSHGHQHNTSTTTPLPPHTHTPNPNPILPSCCSPWHMTPTPTEPARSSGDCPHRGAAAPPPPTSASEATPPATPAATPWAPTQQQQTAPTTASPCAAPRPAAPTHAQDPHPLRTHPQPPLLLAAQTGLRFSCW
jgi:hypothetical protein